MRYAIRIGGALASLMMVGSCASIDRAPSMQEPGSIATTDASFPNPPINDVPVKIGSPFTVGSTTYTPVDAANYDEVGYASSYGAELSGKPTASGEIFVSTAVTAAHKTLPLPSYVEVTALDTGRTILMRINDRGPFANDRLVDLSEGAAQQLGVAAKGDVSVRVRRVNPPEQERAVLRAGLRAAERTKTPGALLGILRDKLAKQPKPSSPIINDTSSTQFAQSGADTPPPADDRFIREGSKPSGRLEAAAPSAISARSSASGRYVVQIAALSSRLRADQLATAMGAKVIASADGKLFRVRLGPYSSEVEAQRRLVDTKKRGYPQARVYRD